MKIDCGYSVLLSDPDYLKHRREIAIKLRPEECIAGKTCDDPNCPLCKKYLLYLESKGCAK